MFGLICRAIVMVLVLAATLVAEESQQSSFADYAAHAEIADAGAVLPMLPGIAQPSQQVTLSAPLDGVLMSIRAREGSDVSHGEIVATMDNRIAAAEVQLANSINDRKAAIARAQYELAGAKVFLSRLLTLENTDAISDVEVDQARNRRDQAQASLAQMQEASQEAELSLQLAQARLESHHIRAPFAGRILRIDGRAGQSVTRATELITLANTDNLRTELYVPINWFGTLKAGTQYKLAADAPVNRAVAATLVATEPVLDAATQTYRCVFEIDNSDQKLPAGFAVRLIQPGSDHRADNLSAVKAAR